MYKNFSPETIVFLEQIKQAIELKLFVSLNFMGGSGRDLKYKSLFCDKTDKTFDITFFGQTLKGQLIYLQYFIMNLLKKHIV